MHFNEKIVICYFVLVSIIICQSVFTPHNCPCPCKQIKIPLQPMPMMETSILSDQETSNVVLWACGCVDYGVGRNHYDSQ